jgi:hypothetical protein
MAVSRHLQKRSRPLAMSTQHGNSMPDTCAEWFTAVLISFLSPADNVLN